MGKTMEPKLRFPGFYDSWDKTSFKKLGKFGKTYSYSRSNEGMGEYHHIHYGDIHSKFNGVIDNNTEVPSITTNKNHELLNNGDIIIADASEDYSDLGKTLVIDVTNKIKLIAGLHTFKFTPNKNLDPIFYMNYSKSGSYKRFMRINGTGVSVLGLSKKNLSSMGITIPSIQEQEKIGRFFSLIDIKIESQEEKLIMLEEYKKGIMQKIFSQEIRFKDKNNNDYPEWQEVKLKKILKERKTYAEKDKGIPHASLTINGIKLKTDRYNRDFLVRTDNKKYKISQEGDICYNPANLKFGVITINKTGTVIFSPIYVTFETKSKTNRQYLSYYLMRWDFINKVRRYEEGTVYERMAVKPVDFLKYKINLPSLEEQTKIANFLCSLDLKIGKETEKLDSLKELKKGLIQKMFI